MIKIFAAGLLVIMATSAQSVTIVNSGSTNTPGFQIVVDASGQAVYSAQASRHALDKNATPAPVRKTLEKPLVKSLFDAVTGAHPLSELPAETCMKSASFGTRLTIEYSGETSPDLSCGDGGNPKLKALIGDVNQIVRLFQNP